MSSKEKANSLIAKFKEETTYKYQEYAGANYSTFEHDIDVLRQCAIVAVDEVLNKDGYNNDYWQEVKIELEKL